MVLNEFGRVKCLVRFLCTSFMFLFLNINTLKLMLVFRSIEVFSFGKLVVDFIIIIIIIIIIINR